MSDLYEISQSTSELKNCPVLVREAPYGFMPGDEERPDFEWGYVPCNSVLQPMVTRTIMGDDYGEVPQYGVYFDCGHTFSQMEESLKMSEYI